MDFSNINEEDIHTTKNGFQYIEVESTDSENLKLRKSFRPDRIKEDEETKEEYELRRDVMNSYIKDKKKGQSIWPANLGTLTQDKVEFLKNYYNV